MVASPTNRRNFLAFTVLALALVALTRPASAQDITSSMLGHWRLVETAGTTAADATSTVQNGTYTNGVALASSAPAPKDAAVSATFDGVDDYVAVASEATFDITGAMTVACWIKVDLFDAQWQAIITKGETAWRLTRDDSNNSVRFTCTGLSTPFVASVASVNDGQWHHVAAVYDGSQLLIYVDGVLNNSVASSGAIATNNNAVRIGANLSLAGREFDGAIYDARVYNRALTAADISTLNNLTGLIAHWKLIETSGTTTTDSSPHLNHGAYANGVTLPAIGPYPGAGDKAASFDGVDDHITTSNEFLYDIRGPITVAAWFRVNAFTVSNQLIVAKGNSAWRLMRSGATNRIRFACNGLSDTSADSVSDVNDGRWHHVVGIYNGTTLSLYVDGVLEASDSSTGPLSNTNHNVYIAENSDSAGRYWNGAIHDVRVYSIAITASQVTALYGCIGHWKLNEASGSTAADSTIAANTGTYTNGPILNQPGVRDAAVDFDGNDDYVGVPGSTSLVATEGVTMAAWIRPTASANLDRMIVNKEGEYEVAIDNTNRIKWAWANTSPGWAWYTTSVYAPNDTWSHVVVTYDGARAKVYINGELVEDVAATGLIGDAHPGLNELRIGGRSNSPAGKYFGGRIDDVRLYSRAISAEQVQELYGLLGHWEFAEGTGTAAADSSGLGNTANLIAGATWTSDCNGMNALQTDGAGGIAQTASAFRPPTEGTVAFWMRSAGNPASNRGVCGLATNWEVRHLTNGTLAFDLGCDAGGAFVTSTTFSEIGRWYHVAATFNAAGNSFAIYIDGQFHSSGTTPAAMAQQASALLSFGARTGSTAYWQGALRDFRVYNRRLSADEIAQFYGLIGHWTLDETSGTTAADASLVGNHATYQGSPTLGAPGRVSYAVQFDGSNDAITNQVFVPPSTGAVAFWVRRTSAITGRQRFFGIAGDWEIWQDPDGIVRCDLGGDGEVGGFKTVSSMAGLGIWYHFAANFDADTYSIYINGVLDASGSMALLPQTSGQLSIAARTGLGIERFQGTLDDLRIYRRMLCPIEIQQLYAGGSFEGVRIIRWVEIQ